MDYSRPYEGKPWQELTRKKKVTARERRYVDDVEAQPPAVRAAIERADQRMIARIQAREALRSQLELDQILSENEKRFNPDGSRRNLTRG